MSLIDSGIVARFISALHRREDSAEKQPHSGTVGRGLESAESDFAIAHESSMCYSCAVFHNLQKEDQIVLSDWQFIGLFVALSPIFPAAPVLLNWVLGPRKPNALKQQTYECGIETVGDAWVQFKVQYYIYALIFVIFDIEAVFLFPIAVAFGQLGAFAIGATVLFVILLADGLVYAWNKGALEWF
jgi:NADH-quinone oxidoreductase subunit A